MSGPFSRFRERIQEPEGGSLTPNQILGKYITYSNGVPIQTQNVYAEASVYTGIQRTWDQLHPIEGGGSHTYRAGGPFLSIKTKRHSHEVLGSGVVSNVGKPGITFPNRTEYQGAFAHPTLAPAEYTSNEYSTAGGTNYATNPLIPSTTYWESEAWNIAPKIEKWGALNALYELKDVPGMLRQTARFYHDTWKAMGGSSAGPLMKPSRVASDFLNVQFGWIPFINDVTALCKGVIFSDYYINQTVKDNNTWIKRYKVLQDTVSSSRIYFVGGPGCKPTGESIDQLCAQLWEGGPRSVYEVHKQVQDLVWAKGQFKYYRPEFDDSLPYYGSTFNSMQQYLSLFGLRVNPTHVWRAIPWSWAVDWFSNVGDLIERSRAIAEDGLVAKYLYLMHHRIGRIRGLHKYNFYSGQKTFESNRLVEVKQRKSNDSPYGFVLGGSLNATQWSILAALGLSRNVNFAKSF